jgi:S-adenosylmethionine hydrolase
MITLTTDFGLKDPYVAEMKAAILGINPQANIVDVSHLVDKFSVRMGAFILASAAPHFPKGTVHVAVIDPGVGTERRAILIETKQACYVGPDNGVLMLAAQAQSIKHIYRLSNPKLMRQEISSTFHGRDIFAPAAAYLDLGC